MQCQDQEDIDQQRGVAYVDIYIIDHFTVSIFKFCMISPLRTTSIHMNIPNATTFFNELRRYLYIYVYMWLIKEHAG